MGGGLMAMISGLLGGMGGGAMGGVDAFGANANGKIMGGGVMGGGGGGSPFQSGMMAGLGGGGGGGGGVKHAKNTKDIDHELGLSALQHYQDLSHNDFSGMNEGMSFANNIRPGQGVAPMPQTQPNQYVQAIMSNMRGNMQPQQSTQSPFVQALLSGRFGGR